MGSVPEITCAEEEPRAANREEWEAKLAGIEAAIESCHEQIRLLRELELRFNRQYGEVCKAGYKR